MKLVQYYTASDSTPQLGIERRRDIINVKKMSSHFNPDKNYTLDSIMENSTEQLGELSEMLEKLGTSTLDINDFSDKKEQIHYLPVIQDPDKIICVGMNYLDFVKEVDGEVPLTPILYNKFNNALAAHKQEIPLPAVARQVDYSAELVVVIGKEMKDVHDGDVFDGIFGYTVGNNFADRRLQKQTSQWMLGKTLDYFAPVGPAIVTKDEIPDLNNLYVTLKVNNEVVQNGNTKDMIFSVQNLISYLSKHITLKPGDLIFTGTPKGVISGRPDEDQRWLSQNDLVEVTISNVGTLINQIK